MDNLLNIYTAIFVSKSERVAVYQLKNGKVFRASDDSIHELQIFKIVDETKHMIRFYNMVEGVKKWGILHIKGFNIIPPIYDYISPMIADNFFRVFIGDYTWEFDENTANLFYDYLWSDSWNGDSYVGTLKHGKWGIVNTDNKLLVPVAYEWIEIIDDKTACCNVGGSRIIKWFDGDDKENILSIADGLWKVIYLDQSIKLETQLGAYNEVLALFKKEYAKLMVSGDEYEFYAHSWQKIIKFNTNNNEKITHGLYKHL